MSINFRELVLKSSPNQYLVAPEGLCQRDKPHRLSPVYDGSVEALRDRFLDVVRRQPRIEELPREKRRAPLQYEFVQRTALLRFPDFISVRFIKLSEKTSGLAIYSRSKYGYSDLGANRARIDDWLDQLDGAEKTL